MLKSAPRRDGAAAVGWDGRHPGFAKGVAGMDIAHGQSVRVSAAVSRLRPVRGSLLSRSASGAPAMEAHTGEWTGARDTAHGKVMARLRLEAEERMVVALIAGQLAMSSARSSAQAQRL